jgi:hypothetical protein
MVKDLLLRSVLFNVLDKEVCIDVVFFWCCVQNIEKEWKKREGDYAKYQEAVRAL